MQLYAERQCGTAFASRHGLRYLSGVHLMAAGGALGRCAGNVWHCGAGEAGGRLCRPGNDLAQALSQECWELLPLPHLDLILAKFLRLTLQLSHPDTPLCILTSIMQSLRHFCLETKIPSSQTSNSTSLFSPVTNPPSIARLHLAKFESTIHGLLLASRYAVTQHARSTPIPTMRLPLHHVFVTRPSPPET